MRPSALLAVFTRTHGHAALALACDDFDRDKLGARWVDWIVGASGVKT